MNVSRTITLGTIAILLLILPVFADTIYESSVNNTDQNISIYSDIAVTFNDLDDNTSGIYIINISFINNSILYQCNNVEFIIPNTSYLSSAFPLSGWSCNTSVVAVSIYDFIITPEYVYTDALEPVSISFWTYSATPDTLIINITQDGVLIYNDTITSLNQTQNTIITMNNSDPAVYNVYIKFNDTTGNIATQSGQYSIYERFQESTIFTIGVFGVFVAIALVLVIIGMLIDGINNYQREDGKGTNVSSGFYVPSAIIFLIIGIAMVTNGIAIPIGTNTTLINDTTVEIINYAKAPVFANLSGLLFILVGIGIFARTYYLYRNYRQIDDKYQDNRKVYKLPKM